jgi:hypothetical protein
MPELPLTHFDHFSFDEFPAYAGITLRKIQEVFKRE